MSNDQCRAQPNTQQAAGIGCFSMILIGAMIFFIGRWSSAPISAGIAELTAQVETLSEETEALHTELGALRYELRGVIAPE